VTTMSGMPAYLQVADDLRTQIRTGALEPGAQLPSMTQLRQRYGVSNTVVRDALNELRRDGLVVGQQGKGVFVRPTGESATSANGDGGDDSAELRRELADLQRRVGALESRLQMDDSGRQQ
jgi:GntR family transcriptional regulator